MPGSNLFLPNRYFKRDNSLYLSVILCEYGPGQRSWYSDSLKAGRSETQIPVERKFSAPVQTSPGAHPTSCTVGNGSLSLGKAGGAWR